MTLAEKLLLFINQGITNNKNVYVSTTYRCTKITPKTFDAWTKTGKPLFFIDKEGSLRIRAGKGADIICTKNINLVRVTLE